MHRHSAVDDVDIEPGHAIEQSQPIADQRSFRRTVHAAHAEDDGFATCGWYGFRGNGRIAADAVASVAWGQHRAEAFISAAYLEPCSGYRVKKLQ